MISEDEFLAAWKAWDASPGIPETAGQFEDACQEFAHITKRGATLLRSDLMKLRRSGFSHEEALAKIMKEPPFSRTPPPVVNYNGIRRVTDTEPLP